MKVKSERGYTLIECLVYIAMLAIVLNLSIMAFFRYNQHTNNLRRNADDITRALRAGERWRDDVRAAVAPPHVIENGLAIPQRSGEVAYMFADGAIWRQAAGTRSLVLKQVKASAMSDDSRPHVAAWHWELELVSPQKIIRIRPLFSFTAVSGRPS
jgi:type II secretory pathway pseudopilin PulG